MTRTTTNSFGQPSLEDLTVRFLATRSDAAATAVEPGEGDVEPHEVTTGFRVDPMAAWKDATRQITAATVPLPPEWATLVNQPVSAFAVPMALGHFPQRVRDLQPLLARFEPDDLRPSPEQSPVTGFSSLRNWVGNNARTQPLLAAGIARVLGDFELARQLLADGNDVATANERAAVLWQSGKCAEALAVWKSLPASPAVLFNRGMAELFLGNLAEAKTALSLAVEGLPETSGWNALAQLYLAVAEIHG